MACCSYGLARDPAGVECSRAARITSPVITGRRGQTAELLSTSFAFSDCRHFVDPTRGKAGNLRNYADRGGQEVGGAVVTIDTGRQRAIVWNPIDKKHNSILASIVEVELEFDCQRFGSDTAVQRCENLQTRNVLEPLPKFDEASVRR